MDMTSLSSTLPGGSSRRPNPPKQLPLDPNSESQSLIEAFQSAARSVTNLYRSSATLIQNSRQDGYTDALSDVLEAIDNMSAYDDPALALSRIRDWVIDRRHESKGGSGNTTGRSSSMPPQQTREMSSESEAEEGNAKEEERRRADSEKPEVGYPDLPQEQPSHTQSLQSIPFSFQALNPIPQYPTQTPDVMEPLPSPEMNGMFTFNSPVATTPLGLNGRQTTNKVPLTNRNISTSLGGGAGTKRRNQYVDFFDINGFGNFGMNGSRDFVTGTGPGNAKRGRFV